MQFVGGLAAGEDGWAPVKDAQYAVHLHHGRHTVHVRAQNTYGRAGAVSTVTFEVAPGVRAREGAAVLIQSVLRGRRDRRAGAGRLLAAAREAEAAHRKASRSAVPRTSSSASEGGYSVSHPVGSLDPEPSTDPRGRKAWTPRAGGHRGDRHDGGGPHHVRGRVAPGRRTAAGGDAS